MLFYLSLSHILYFVKLTLNLKPLLVIGFKAFHFFSLCLTHYVKVISKKLNDKVP
nr:MAG TPA: hypothetical protein [Caudoviricetes sp.]